VQTASFRKPIFVTATALIGFSVYFPFCGVDVDGLSPDLCWRCIVLGVLQLLNFLGFMVGMNILPISTTIIVRV
jgi:hypothetical protein